MRRWSTALALSVVVGCLSVSGCGQPGGVDGRLVDDWAPMSEPVSFTPPAEVCHTTPFADTVYLESFNPVACASSHRLETVYVGTFTGADAGRDAPPKQGSSELSTAFATCDSKATAYLGAQWRSGRLWLGVALPSAPAWLGGARWFRCDMTEQSNVEDNGDVISRDASLKDALKSPSRLSLGCFAAKLTRIATIESMPAVDCGKAHNSEFVGVWMPANVGYPDKDSDWVPFYTGCRSQVAKYVGLPDDANLRFRTGVVALPSAPADWRAGNHGVRCYLWLSERTLTASLKGAGAAGLPINTK